MSELERLKERKKNLGDLNPFSPVDQWIRHYTVQSDICDEYQRELSDALAEIERYKAMLRKSFLIHIALPRYESDGEYKLVRRKVGESEVWTVWKPAGEWIGGFSSALEAFESLAATDSTGGDSTGAGEEENESKSLD
jgi:hypothetical protein